MGKGGRGRFSLVSQAFVLFCFSFGPQHSVEGLVFNTWPQISYTNTFKIIFCVHL